MEFSQMHILLVDFTPSAVWQATLQIKRSIYLYSFSFWLMH